MRQSHLCFQHLICSFILYPSQTAMTLLRTPGKLMMIEVLPICMLIPYDSMRPFWDTAPCPGECHSTHCLSVVCCYKKIRTNAVSLEVGVRLTERQSTCFIERWDGCKSGIPNRQAAEVHLLLAYSLRVCTKVVASPELAAAVTNAGGLGVFGGVHYAPWLLRQKLEDLVASQLPQGAKTST